MRASTGDPVGDARLSATWGASEQQWLPRSSFTEEITNKEGRFVLPEPSSNRGSPASGMLLVEASGYLPCWVRLSEVPRKDGLLRIALEDGDTIQGRVRSTAGQAVPGAKIVLRSPSAESLLDGHSSLVRFGAVPATQHTCVSGPAGEIRFTGLAPGQYEVTADKPGWVHEIDSRRIGDSSDREGQSPIVVNSRPTLLLKSGDTDAIVTLAEVARVRVTVRGTGSRPTPVGTVVSTALQRVSPWLARQGGEGRSEPPVAMGADGNQTWSFFFVRAPGKESASPGADNTVLIRASAPGFRAAEGRWEPMSLNSEGDGIRVIELAPVEPGTGWLDLRCRLGAALFRGPMEIALIHWEDEGRSERGRVSSAIRVDPGMGDAARRLELPPGRYRLGLLGTPGAKSLNWWREVEVRDGAVTEFEMNPEVGLLRISAESVDGVPVSRGSIWHGVSGPVVQRARYSLSPGSTTGSRDILVHGGTHEFWIEAPGYRKSELIRVEVAVGETVESVVKVQRDTE